MRTIGEKAHNIPVLDEVDVVVTGGGPSGIIAAIAAVNVPVTKAYLSTSLVCKATRLVAVIVLSP